MSRTTISQTNGQYPRASLQNADTAETLVTMLDEHAGALDALEAPSTDAVGDGTTSNLEAALRVLTIAVPDHATQTLVYKLTHKLEILRMDVIKSGAGATNTIQLTDGADAAISDAVAAATDKAVTSAGTLDPAKRVISAGGSIKLVCTRNNGTMAATVVLYCVKRA